jgi:hypothetical protein
MPGKAMIILILGFILLTGLLLAGILKTSNNISKNMVTDFQKKAVYNLAQSGANIGLRRFLDNQSYREPTGTDSAMLNGRVSIRVIDSGGTNVVAVKSIGYSGNFSTDSISYRSTALLTSMNMPFIGKGAFNSPSGITYKWNGGGDIDGRNYTAAGTRIVSPAGTGTYAVWTTGTVGIPGKSASIEGTTNGIDYAPGAGTLDTHIVRQNQSYPPSYPNTPDQVMGGTANGYPSGTLMNMAKGGAAGSQYFYTNNTSNISLSNISGITYVDYNGGSLGGISGSGILVINNLTANMLSVSTVMHSSFAGIVIFSNNIDFGVKQGGVIGMVIVYGEASNANLTLSDLSINGQGYIHYSSEAIQNALKSVWSPKIVWFER